MTHNYDKIKKNRSFRVVDRVRLAWSGNLDVDLFDVRRTFLEHLNL